MPFLPPLDCLRLFEVAAHHERFARAAQEFRVTPAAVAYRIRKLEDRLVDTLLERRQRSVRLDPHGRACLGDVQRIPADIMGATKVAPDTVAWTRSNASPTRAMCFKSRRRPARRS